MIVAFPCHFHVALLTGPITVVVVNDIDSAMEVLVKKGADFATRMTSVSRMLRFSDRTYMVSFLLLFFFAEG